MNKIEYLKLMIDEARSEGMHNVADLYCDQLQEAQDIDRVENFLGLIKGVNE